MMTTPYIEVAVTLPVYQTFTYRLPEHFCAQAQPGMRVLVPFGRRRVTGYILAGRKSAHGFKAKNILDILDTSPLFTGQMIGFFRWMAEYYIYPAGEVIKAALPSGLDRHDVTLVAPGQKMPDPDGPDVGPAEKLVLDCLSKSTPLSVRQLARQTKNTSIHSLVRKMEKARWVECNTKLKPQGVSMKTARFLEPGGIRPGDKKISKKRLQILDMVCAAPGISLDVVKQSVPSAVRLIRPLSEQGYIRIVEKQVFRDPFGDPVPPDIPPALTVAQEKVVKRVSGCMTAGFSPFLLWGVTGSGKTEVYMRLVAAAVEAGRKAIVLVPEISLISQTERRFRARFQNRVAVIHSALSPGERLDQWYRIRQDKADVVIGARSCIFAPVEPLGLIIVDEEHDGSYKQESGLRYNARDMALVRGKLDRVPVVLGSATPSVQSYHNAVQQKFTLLCLPERINQKPLPQITCIDLKKYRESRAADRLITPELAAGIRHCLDSGNQALIFLNRRGYASFPVCGSCGQTVSCRHCDITMTYHKAAGELRCHLCGMVQPVSLRCPACDADKVKILGFGTEKIELLLKKMFPHARVVRMDQDTTRAKGQMVRILKSIRNRTVDIVVGTQMLAKGHDFPSITLVGIICADLALSLPDFRASERTFQVLAQVAGRTGRGDKTGTVIMQTYNPDHFSMEAARTQDVVQFYQMEIPFRKALMYPPFSRIILLKFSGRKKERVEDAAVMAGDLLGRIIDDTPDLAGRIQVMGPVPAVIGKISSRYRWQILIKGALASELNLVVRQMLGNSKLKALKDIKLAVDVDPYSLL